MTAASGDLGQAIIKALRLSGDDWRIHGCDLDSEGVGQFFVDGFAIVPRADHPDYLSALDAAAVEASASAVIPSSEPEIRALAVVPGWPRLPGGAVIVSQSADLLRRLGDKLEAMRALQGHVALAPFADGLDDDAVSTLIDEAGFPLVVKERESSGSRGVTIVSDRDQLGRALAATRSPVLQAFIDDTEGEFSVGVFTSQGSIRTLSFRRSLRSHGPSMYAELDDDPDVVTYSREVAAAVGPPGSINVQVRKSRAGVRLLEINPRFSSLAAARSAAGFPDVRWSVELALGVTPSRLVAPVRELRFRRYFTELIDFGNGEQRPPEWEPRI